MRKVITIISVFALLLGMLVPGASATEDTTCPCCGTENVTWEVLTDGATLEAGVHYRLESNVSGLGRSITTAGTYCIDLAGYTISGTSKVFNLGAKASEGSPAVIMNVMDSSEAQTGLIQGYGNSGNAGGMFYVFAGSVFNLYGGTIKPNTEDVVAYCGGVFSLYGTLNVYGGTMIGGKLGGTSTQPHVGGTVCVQSTGDANFYGGTVRSGTAESDELGHCIYVKSGGSVKLSGAAMVDQIAFGGDAASQLTVSNVYTGTVELLLSDTAAGTAIGISDNADISAASITVAGTELMAMVSGTSIVAGQSGRCEVCDKNVVWQELSGALPTTASGHYRLTKNVGASQVQIQQNTQICLDLAGYTYAGSGRTFVLGKYAGTYAITMNIMDSSEAQTGRLTGRGGSAAMAGGVIYNYKNTVVNIYGGTVQGLGSGSVMAKDGGAIDTYGTVNVYGGTLIGNDVARYGGTVCLLAATSVLNMEGGALISGTAGEAGDCVYAVSGATVKLSGDASPEQIYFADSSADTLIVSGNYTGKTSLAYATVPEEGTDLGNCSGATINRESIAIEGARMNAVKTGDDLLATVLSGASLTDAQGKVAYYDTLAEAAGAKTEGSVIKLLADNSEAVTVSGDITLDLYGWELGGNLTVNDGTLYVMDSATDDYTVEDLEGYGVISGTVTGNVEPAENYLKLAETAGDSYHRYTLKLSKVNLRPGTTGIYYTSDILLDAAMLSAISSFGIAVSVKNALPTADPADAESLFTAYTPAQYNEDGATSVLINGIMDGEATDAVDADTTIYSRPYIQFTDGTYFYGNSYATDLRETTETVDSELWGKMTLAQNRALMAMYDTYATAMEGWSLTNMAASVAKKKAAAEDGVLKAIVIGNSASVDATALLAGIFKKEAPEQEFVLGCMYESGCSVSGHVGFLEANAPVYTYYKNTGTYQNGAWTLLKESTLEDGLSDQNWDVVIFQELHTISGLQSTFENDNLETLITYVVDTLGYEPQLDWHSVGIIPEIPEAYVQYVNSLEGDDGGGTDAGENENWEDTGVEEPEDLAWIFDIARPGYPVTWAKNYIKNFNNDAQTMYDAICQVAVNHVIPSTVYSFDDVIPGGSVIQYARNACGMTDQDLFRDYAHKSDFGRVLIGYVWYAELMEIESFTELAYTTVPAAMRHKSSPDEDLVLTPEQIQIVLDSVNYALANPFDSPEPVTAE